MKWFGGVVGVACLGSQLSCAPPEQDHVSRVSAAIVDGTASGPEEDFTVFVVAAQPDGKKSYCGGVLVAPNLVMTARHCIVQSLNMSYSCGPDGEPPVGGGGFVTGLIGIESIRVFAGVGAAGSFYHGTDLGVAPTQIVVEQSTSFCSHDVAALVLASPLANMPVAKLRLGRRPRAGDRLTVTGWGGDGGTTFLVFDRKRRDDLTVVAVGPSRVGEPSDGSAPPRIFKTTVGACTDDSGGPTFDPATGALLGLVIRGNDFSPNPTRSECLAPGAAVSHLAIADVGDLLHRAFAAAGSAPALEGRTGLGWLGFGEACAVDAACESNVCAGGACNVDCRTSACPADLTCDAKTSHCIKPSVAPASPSPDAGSTETPRSAKGNDCGVSPSGDWRASLLVLSLCATLLWRRRKEQS